MGRLTRQRVATAVAGISLAVTAVPRLALAEPVPGVGSVISFKAPGGIPYTVDLRQISTASQGFGDGEDGVFTLTNHSLTHRLSLDPGRDAGLLGESLLSSPKAYPPSAAPDSGCSHYIFAPQLLAPRHSVTGCLAFPVPVLAKVIGVEWVAGPGQFATWTVEV